MNRITLSFIAASLLWMGCASAADYCVGSGAEFDAALQEAAASVEDDLIRLTGVALDLTNPVNTTVHGSLQIRGGYSDGCPIFGSVGQGTTLTGNGVDAFYLRLRDGNLTLARVRFNDHALISVSDTSFASAVRTGRILMQRVRVFGNRTGMLVYSDHHDVRIENSRFETSSNNGGNIYTGTGLALTRFSVDAPEIDIVVLNNTLTGNQHGLVMASGGAFNDRALLYNNISFANRSIDLLVRRPVVARHNLWPVTQVDFDGVLEPGSEGNLAVDPQLDGSLRPIEPGSPVINAGDDEVEGGLPAQDYLGGARRIGSRVDIGALESAVNDLPVITVINTNDSGAGSLRQAIVDANSAPNETSIAFDIPGACPQIIQLDSALPALTEPVVIDGYSQPGSVYNQADRSFDGTLCVALVPELAMATGLHLQTAPGDTMRVEGLAFYGFQSEAVRVTGQGSAEVRGNGFGTGAAGLLAPGFDDAAIRVIDAAGSVIGGADVAARNVIARATQAGVRLEGNGARTVRGNLIGFDMGGTLNFGNGIGVKVDGGTRNVITGNWIGFSGTRGVLIDNTAEPAQETVITVNTFGVNVNYQAAGNGTNAIRVEAGEEHKIETNQILFSGTDGIAIVTPARRVRLYNNSISSSALQAIDVSPDGVNDIDLDVGATGANDSQNFPILVDAIGSNDAGEVTGVLESANGSYIVQFFRNGVCDADGFGEAQSWIGQTAVTITNATPDANGSASFSADIAGTGNLFNKFITATAIDEEDNSSEASACIAYEVGPQIFRDGFE